MAVGAIYGDGAGDGRDDSGEVYLFTFSDTEFSGGTLQGIIGRGYAGDKDIAVDLDIRDLFGSALAMNGDGTRLAVGAMNGNDVYLMQLSEPSSISNLSYNDQTGSDITLFASDIAHTLSQGINLTLMASNDIILNHDISLIDISQDWGNLSLSAGRSILLNSSIHSYNGDVTLTINDYLANGVVDDDRDEGDAKFLMAENTQIDVGTGDVTINIRMGDDKTHSNVASTTTKGNITATMADNITATTTTIIDEPIASAANDVAQTSKASTQTAKSTADTANTDAQTALNNATQAHGDATNSANGVNDGIDAQSDIDKATTAKDTASTAASTGATALGEAQTAKDEAEQTTDSAIVQQKAESVDDAIDTASTAHDTASTESEKARLAAESAEAIAQSEADAAAQARTHADTAQSAYEQALAKANAAETAAQAAETAAAEAEAQALIAEDAAPDYQATANARAAANEAQTLANEARAAATLAAQAKDDALVKANEADSLATTAQSHADAESLAVANATTAKQQAEAKKAEAWAYYEEIRSISLSLYALLDDLRAIDLADNNYDALMQRHADRVDERNYPIPRQFRTDADPRLRKNQKAEEMINRFIADAHLLRDQRPQFDIKQNGNIITITRINPITPDTQNNEQNDEN